MAKVAKCKVGIEFYQLLHCDGMLLRKPRIDALSIDSSRMFG